MFLKLTSLALAIENPPPIRNTIPHGILFWIVVQSNSVSIRPGYIEIKCYFTILVSDKTMGCLACSLHRYACVNTHTNTHTQN